MTYPFITIALTAILIIYILYLLIIKKDIKMVKSVLFIGVFFIGIWLAFYYFLLR